MNNSLSQFWSSVRLAVPVLLWIASQTAFYSAAPTNIPPCLNHSTMPNPDF